MACDKFTTLYLLALSGKSSKFTVESQANFFCNIKWSCFKGNILANICRLMHGLVCGQLSLLCISLIIPHIIHMSHSATLILSISIEFTQNQSQSQPFSWMINFCGTTCIGWTRNKKKIAADGFNGPSFFFSVCLRNKFGLVLTKKNESSGFQSFVLFHFVAILISRFRRSKKKQHLICLSCFEGWRKVRQDRVWDDEYLESWCQFVVVSFQQVSFTIYRPPIIPIKA